MHQEPCKDFQRIHSGKFRFFIFMLMVLAGMSIPLKSYCQDLEIGIVGGGLYYLGDLNPGTPFKNTQVAYGLDIRYDIDTRWAVKLSGYRGKIKGNSSQTKFLPGRDLGFESNITDISVEAEFNFFDYFIGSGRHFITPYIYAGIGVFFFNPKSGGVALQPLGTEGQNVEGGRKPYSLISVSVPFGLGVKFTVSRRLGFTAFWEMHKTFTDYLDDVSTTYYLNGPAINQDDPAEFLSDPTRDHQPGMQRGNSKNNDWYSFAGISVSYRFMIHGSRKCRDQKFY